MRQKSRKKVVILGGGMAALTFAYELTSHADWTERYSDVAVYQPGWRLGGKAASGRNQQVASRVEVRGPHVWFGFYDNAFRLVQRCYAELKRPEGHPLSRWEQVFQPSDAILVNEVSDEKERPWSLQAPRNDTVPGAPGPQRSPWDYLARGTQLVHDWWKDLCSGRTETLREGDDPQEPLAQQWVDHVTQFMSLLDVAIRETGQIRVLMTTALNILEQTHQTLRDYIKSMPGMDGRERRLWIQMDLTLTAMRGFLSDEVPLKGFDLLDELDFRRWLLGHGASPMALRSELLTGLYNFVFAAIDGDHARQDLAAGVALRLLCRVILEYKGALLWTTRVSMGDAVFAPLYEVLRRRGVRFHFFHRVKNLRLNKDGTSLAEIQLERQATCKRDYEPLIDVKGLPCWPSKPRYEFLKEGKQLQKRDVDLESLSTDWEPVKKSTLRVGRDFDEVVLGISLAAIPDCCPELIAAAPQWQDTLKHTQTVATLVSQFWFDRTLDQLGENMATPILTGCKPALDTWTDFTPSLRWEDWNMSSPPRSAVALRGVLPDTGDTRALEVGDFSEQKQVKAAVLKWLRRHLVQICPKFLGPEQQVQWEFLVDPQHRKGEARFDAQYFCANINPSDRYVQSVAGSTRFRLSADQAWFRNLFICGDWTRTVLNVGCIEAAVMSGLQAAAALRRETVPADLMRDW